MKDVTTLMPSYTPLKGEGMLPVFLFLDWVNEIVLECFGSSEMFDDCQHVWSGTHVFLDVSDSFTVAFCHNTKGMVQHTMIAIRNKSQGYVKIGSEASAAKVFTAPEPDLEAGITNSPFRPGVGSLNNSDAAELEAGQTYLQNTEGSLQVVRRGSRYTSPNNTGVYSAATNQNTIRNANSFDSFEATTV